MQKIGDIYKKFRESRGIKLKDVAKSGVSASQLSRFERGESDLTITKFILALDEINISIDEFMYAVHDFHRDELNEILEQVRHLVTNHDIHGMKKLLISQIEKKSRRETFHKLNTILIKIRLQDLSGEKYYTEKDIRYLSDYLLSVEYWGYYELLLFMNTLDVLNHSLFMILSREMVRRSDFYKDIPNNRRLISTMLLNGYITCIEKNELTDASYFEKQLQHCFFIETEMYEQIVFKYAKNFLYYRKTQKKEALIEMKKCIGMMKLAESYQLSLTFEKHFKKIGL